MQDLIGVAGFVAFDLGQPPNTPLEPTAEKRGGSAAVRWPDAQPGDSRSDAMNAVPRFKRVDNSRCTGLGLLCGAWEEPG